MSPAPNHRHCSPRYPVRFALACWTATILAAPLAAQTSRPVIEINVASGKDASMGADALGRSIVAFATVPPLDGNALRVQRFDSTGNAMGGTAQLTLDNNPPQFSGRYSVPSTAMNAAGDVRVDWIGTPAGSCAGVVPTARLSQTFTFDGFNPGQSGIGTCPGINEEGATEPSVGLSSIGVVAWSAVSSGTPESLRGLDYRVGGTTFNLRGCILLAPPPYCRHYQWQPCVAMRSDGAFAIAFANPETGERDTFYNIHIQQYDSSGSPIGAEVRANQPITATDETTEESAALAIDDAGNIVATWAGGVPDGCTSPTLFRIYARRFQWNATGEPTPLGDQFIVDNDPAWSIENAEGANPTVAITRSTDPQVAGRFIIGWNAIQGSKREVHAQYFDVAGRPLGREFRVNQATDPTEPNGAAVRLMANSAQHTLVYGEDERVYAAWEQNQVSTEKTVWLTILPAGYADSLLQSDCQSASCLKGDANRDGVVNSLDIQAFVAAFAEGRDGTGPRAADSCSPTICAPSTWTATA